MADPPLVTSDLVGLLLILHSGTGTSTGTGTGTSTESINWADYTLQRTLLSRTELSYTLTTNSRIVVGQPLITTDLVEYY